MARKGRSGALSSLLHVLVTCFAILQSCCAQETPKFRLGFLMPYPDKDSAVPERLANEWFTATRVALDVLGPRYPDFKVEPVTLNSNCNYDAAKLAAKTLVESGVVGVVGPACSEAARGAGEIFTEAGIPFVSYAATAKLFGTADYPTFFRTVNDDSHQVEALISAIKFFSWKTIYLFYTDEVYGQSLFDALSAALGSIADLTVKEIKVPFANDAEYAPYIVGLEFTDADSIAVFATTPNAAEGLWKVASESGKLDYPYWYFGTDGATAFDLAGQDDQKFTQAMQGQVGLAPYIGDYTSRSPLIPFLDYWKAQPYSKFPGLVTLDVTPRFTRTRAYVVNLVDAVWSFFEAFKNILAKDGNSSPLTAAKVLDCLLGAPPYGYGCVHFKGCSGTVKFNSTTGERSTASQAARYSVVNLLGLVWEEKSYWQSDKPFYTEPSNMRRAGKVPPGTKAFNITLESAPVVNLPPGIGNAMAPIDSDFVNNFNPPAPPAEADATSNPKNSGGSSTPPPPSSSGPSTGAIVGLVLFLLAIVAALVGGGYWYWKRRQRHPEHDTFVRML